MHDVIITGDCPLQVHEPGQVDECVGQQPCMPVFV